MRAIDRPSAFFGLCSSVAAAGVLLASAASCGGSDTPATASAVPAPDAGGGGLDAGDADAGPACAPGASPCEGACVDTSKDRANCGACGVACKIGEACRSGACVASLGFATRRLFLGESDRSGVSSPSAWKSYGENIDGLTSTAADGGECKPVAGASASSRADGDGGIDNAWGKSIIPLLSPFDPTPSQTASAQLEAGGRTPMLVFGAGGSGAAPFAVGFVAAEKSLLPAWDGTDVRPIAEAWTTAGAPKVVFASASVNAGAFTSGEAPGPVLLGLSFGGVPFELPVAKAHVTMKIAADGLTAAEGTLSGVVATEDLVAAIARSAGEASAELCSGSTIESIEQTVRQASDILADGTQDPAKDCDGISIGLGFEAVAVTVGDVAPAVSPPPDPCAP